MTTADIAIPLLRPLSGLLSPAGSRARLSILIFHRVLSTPDPLLPDDPDAVRFRWQMQTVARLFNVLPLSEAVVRLADQSLPPCAACITFDDGYADNVEVAVPILRELQLSATFFIAVGYLNGGMMFNDRVLETLRRVPAGELDLHCVGLPSQRVDTMEQRHAVAMAVIRAVKHLDVAEREDRVQALAQQSPEPLPTDLMMTTAQLQRLASSGMEIGGHTQTHPILTKITDAQVREEIAGGREILESWLGQPVRLFAYPNGKPGQDYAPRHVDMVREAGFTAAVSTVPGVSTCHSNQWQLARFTPWDTTPLRFAAKLVGNLTLRVE